MITFSTSQRVITRQRGFQNGVWLLCNAACCGRDHCGRRARRTDRSEQQEGNRYQAWEGWATSRNELVSLVNSIITGVRVASGLSDISGGGKSNKGGCWRIQALFLSPCLYVAFKQLASPFKFHPVPIQHACLHPNPSPLPAHTCVSGGCTDPEHAQWLAGRGERWNDCTGDLLPSLGCKWMDQWERTELASVLCSVCDCMRVCACLYNTCVLAVSSIREGETSWHRNSSGSNGIRLMTKLIEGLTRTGTDKAALFVCTHI